MSRRSKQNTQPKPPNPRVVQPNVHSEKKWPWQWIGSIAVAVLVLCSGAYYNHISNRPYLSWDSGEPHPYQIGINMASASKFRNHGKTPARHLRGWFTTIPLRRENHSLPYKEWTQEAEGYINATYFKGEPHNLTDFGAIPPDLDQTFEMPSRFAFTNQDLTYQNNGDFRLYYIGEMIYDTGWITTGTTDFCFYIDSPNSNLVVRCNSHNDAR
jgi:hypothetical protein